MPFVRAAPIQLAVLLACSAAQAQVVTTFDGAAVLNEEVAFNPSIHRLYIARETANVVGVIDGTTNSKAATPMAGHWAGRPCHTAP